MGRVYTRIAIALLLSISSSYANELKKVNILSWWGYLSEKSIKSVEDKCKIKLFVDEYYSSSEFLRRWEENTKAHDIIIFSNTINNAVKDKLNNRTIPNLITTPYHPSVEEKVKSIKLSRNTRLLALSLTGFLWNKQNMNIHEGLSLEDMLGLANDKLVVILDDAMEGLEILNNLKFFQTSASDGKLKAKVVIANDIESLANQPNFSFAYHWSGGVIDIMRKKPGKFEFLVHPKLSQVTADLISIMNPKKETICAYNTIAGVGLLESLQKESFYFSPYGGIKGNENPIFKKLYKNYFLNLKKYRWLEQPQMQDFKVIDDRWKKLKAQLSN